MQSNKYCELSAADDEISQMYTAACDASYDETSFWSLYYVLYVPYLDYPDCAKGIFSDLDYLIDHHDEYLGTAASLSLAVMYLW
jgi:hypothetical protein